MLASLRIKDLAVVESLDLELEQGLTVLTGETGAGKSILLTALGLALGDRADSGFVRVGADRAEIELEFSVFQATAARQWLADNELLDAEETCLIRRVVSVDGASKAFVNNRRMTLQSLQELASTLVEIHGQHAHLHLLHGSEQRRLLDVAADNLALLEKIADLHRQWRSSRAELENKIRAAQDGAAREELLRYQIEELEQHEIETLDYDAISEEHGLQANMGKILATGQSQLELLFEDERHSVDALLSQAVHALAEIGQIAPEFGDIVTLLGEAQIQAKEAGLELRRKLQKMEADPQRLQWLDGKLADMHSLARKHHIAPQELCQRLQAMREELNGIEHGSEQIARLEAELEKLTVDYAQSAAELSSRRRQAAQRLQERISGMIRELGMPQGEFRIEVSAEPDQDPNPYGYDRIDFLVSANPGLPPRPLAKVASGGELSRISLCIQVVATDAKTVPTLIFDEVDSGIGGSVAEVVGHKLRTLGADRQVFCVTHLHQVAALGHHHLLVEKSSAAGMTQTQVRKLTAEQRKHEIARMLGGIRITEQTLAHAEELLNNQAEDRYR